LCRVVDDVRTRYQLGDPQVHKLLKDIEAIEKMVPDEDIEEAA
jgi:hypothetical protein